MGGGQSKNQEIKKAYVTASTEKNGLPKAKPSKKDKPTLVSMLNSDSHMISRLTISQFS